MAGLALRAQAVRDPPHVAKILTCFDYPTARAALLLRLLRRQHGGVITQLVGVAFAAYAHAPAFKPRRKERGRQADAAHPTPLPCPGCPLGGGRYNSAKQEQSRLVTKFVLPQSMIISNEIGIQSHHNVRPRRPVCPRLFMHRQHGGGSKAASGALHWAKTEECDDCPDYSLSFRHAVHPAPLLLQLGSDPPPEVVAARARKVRSLVRPLPKHPRRVPFVTLRALQKLNLLSCSANVFG